MSKRKVKICKDTGCQNTATTLGYCRIHYLKNWHEIKREQKAKSVQNLNRYIEHVMKANPDGYLDVIRHDLHDEDHFRETAEHFMSDEDFNDMLQDIGDDDIANIIGSIKIDDSY